MRLAVTLFILIGPLLAVYAQGPAPDTVLQLEGVTIVSDRLGKYTSGLVVEEMDSMTRRENPGGSLSELIPGFTSAYVRNYGPGTLTTLSVRGTSANHAGLLWNGIRLSPPNIGYIDLSLIQGNFFNSVSILYGGASPMFGSGSIGGGVHLNNRPSFDTTGWEGQIGLSAGSYMSFVTDGTVQYSSKNLYSHTAFSLSGSGNEFAYKDLEGDKEKMDHAGYFKGGFLQDLAVSLPGNQYLMASAWFQYGDRDIPPTLTESTSDAEQMDRSWRSMIVWKDFNSRNTLEAKAAWFNEFTRYRDPNADVYSGIHSQTISAAFESSWDLFKASSLFAGMNYTHEYADLNYYDSPENQDNIALFASWVQAFPSAGWKLSLNIRQEFLTGFQVPFLYSAGSEGKIWKFISGRLNFSRNFRAPTFNERFWQPGGNPDLKPEDSYNLEAGITIEPEWNRTSLEISVTGFSSWVNNWILWLPGNGGLWYVENAQEVWSRGMEIAAGQSLLIHKLSLYCSGSYTMSFSTNEKKLFEYDDSFKKQLIYTPVHRFLVKAGAEWKGFRLTFRGNYTGIVYTSRDNESSLPAYFLLDGIISKTFNIRDKFPVSLQINLNNMMDKHYEVVPFRPMPGLNVLGTVIFGLRG